MMRSTTLYIIVLCVLLAACNNTQQTEAPPSSSTPGNTRVPLATTPAADASVPTLTTLNIQVTPVIMRNVPTATPACTGTPRTRLTIGNRAQVSPEDETPLNVRSGPSTEFRILGRLTVLERFLILEGPECGGDYVWYQVRSDNGLEGWIAEGVGNLYFVEPYPPG